MLKNFVIEVKNNIFNQSFVGSLIGTLCRWEQATRKMKYEMKITDKSLRERDIYFTNMF